MVLVCEEYIHEEGSWTDEPKGCPQSSMRWRDKRRRRAVPWTQGYPFAINVTAKRVAREGFEDGDITLCSSKGGDG